MDATLLHIQPAAPQPIYRQIAEQIRRLVAGGQLAAGTTLPSVRDVAAAPPSPQQRWDLLEPALDALARQARELELSPDELLARLRLRMEEHA